MKANNPPKPAGQDNPHPGRQQGDFLTGYANAKLADQDAPDPRRQTWGPLGTSGGAYQPPKLSVQRPTLGQSGVKEASVSQDLKGKSRLPPPQVPVAPQGVGKPPSETQVRVNLSEFFRGFNSYGSSSSSTFVVRKPPGFHRKLSG